MCVCVGAGATAAFAAALDDEYGETLALRRFYRILAYLERQAKQQVKTLNKIQLKRRSWRKKKHQK